MAASRENSLEDLAEGLARGDRAVLARAITLMESKRADHRATARDLLRGAMPRTGAAIRVGITGVPGVGKSTAIDSLGALLTGQGRKVAVLAVDPSSSRTGGAILGDKTRMARLSADARRLHPPLPVLRHPRRRGREDRETTLLLRGGGIRRDPGGDGRRRAVGNGGRRPHRLLPRPDAPGRGDELRASRRASWSSRT
jgi:LAO/AO transport system kinase